eukprot:CAMPEP_0196587174 /NCGR_PEP_ID=MMETSP1081-20130531/56647_1 /TAXON_ID=36882 /ORGANISM="Pyramimonas amylifera, Strain CCMP720" /LENGTH=538 /DNA_ID=CAMNT_0041909281 /DNA_START=308 /DNA_END=1924 /DNA_ORIENTATION=-
MYSGQTGVVFGTGASLNRYRHSEYDELGKRVVTFGSNSIIYSGIPIDHLFIADPAVSDTPSILAPGVGYANNAKQVDAFKCRVKKWFASWPAKTDHMPRAEAVKHAGGTFFEADGPSTGPHIPVQDVGTYLFGSATSTPLFALQFALYTGVERIFIVGVDLKNAEQSAFRAPQTALEYLRSRRFRSDKYDMLPQQEEWWMGAMAQHQFYPNVDVYTVNPGGGLFNITQPMWTDLQLRKGEPLPFSKFTTTNGFRYMWTMNIIKGCVLALLALILPLALRHLAFVPLPAWLLALSRHSRHTVTRCFQQLPGVHFLSSSPEVLLLIRTLAPLGRDMWAVSQALFEFVVTRWMGAAQSLAEGAAARAKKAGEIVVGVMQEAQLVLRLLWAPIRAQFVTPAITAVVKHPTVVMIWHHSFTQFLVQFFVFAAQTSYQALMRMFAVAYDFILAVPVIAVQTIWVVVFTPLIVTATILDVFMGVKPEKVSEDSSYKLQQNNNGEYTKAETNVGKSAFEMKVDENDTTTTIELSQDVPSKRDLEQN